MIINIILGVVVPFILFVFACYFVKRYRDNDVIKWVKVAVLAAEQIYGENGIGKEKFDYVSNWIKDKFYVSDEDLKNLIEFAVYEMKNSIKD